jgi:hypothetical protein
LALLLLEDVTKAKKKLLHEAVCPVSSIFYISSLDILTTDADKVGCGVQFNPKDESVLGLHV